MGSKIQLLKPIKITTKRTYFWSQLKRLSVVPNYLSIFPSQIASVQFSGSVVYDSLKWRSEVAQSCPALCNPMDSSLHQAPPSMGFSRQEYWSGLPFPSPGDLPDPGIKPRSRHCRQALHRLSQVCMPKACASQQEEACAPQQEKTLRWEACEP